MRENFRSLSLPCMLAILSLPILWTASAVAQKTVAKDAGGGRKLELVYNSADQVVEERMLGPDGKVLQKTEYQYRPGFFAPQEVMTFYWPDGKVKQITENSYDENSNFLLEYIQVFDQSGKHVGGHRLTHDPRTNVFHCMEWNPAGQDYKEVKCPAGEEGGEEGPEEVKKFTYDEVTKALDAARETARQEQKQRRMLPMAPTHLPVTTANREVGLVLPVQLQPGQRVSGSIVSDPAKFDGMPQVTVLRVTLPFDSDGDASRLQGWNFEAPGEEAQRADEPVSFVVPRSGQSFEVKFHKTGNAEPAVTKQVALPAGSTKPIPQASFKAAAICMRSQLCTVAGPFSGDSRKTFASFAERPATIVAETTSMAYIGIPERTEAGSYRPLFLAEGQRVVGLPVVVGELTVEPEQQRDLKKGQTLLVYLRLEGPGELPDPEWQSGNFPTSNLAEARKLVPGFRLPKEDREDRDKREEKDKKGKVSREHDEHEGGEVLVVVKNGSTDLVSYRGSKDEAFIFPLRRNCFSRGAWDYKFVVEAKETGTFVIKTWAIPFFAPVAGQEFSVKTGATARN